MARPTISPVLTMPPEGKQVEDVNSLLSTLRSSQTFDFLRIAANADLKKFLAANTKKGGIAETVQFSDDVIKINDRGRKQTRSLLITNRAIYNFTPKTYSKCNRRIALAQLRGLCLSRSSDELVLQVVDSYDYRFQVRRREELVEMIQRFFDESKEIKTIQLQLAYSEEPELKDHVVTKAMQKKLDTQPLSLKPEESKIAKRKLSLGGAGVASPPTPSSGGLRDRDERIEQPKSAPPVHTMITHINHSAGARGHSTHMEGWLAKKKGKADKWERKLVVLLGDILQYYAPLIKGNTLIEGAVYIEKIFANNTVGNAKLQQLLGTAGGADEEKGLPRKHLTNRFKVISGDKKDTLLAAETPAEMDRWIAAFKTRALKDKAQHTTIEGWLMKKEETKIWVKRYCVLIDDRLWIYEMLPKGSIDLVTGTGATAAGVVMPTEEAGRKNFAGIAAISRFAYRWNINNATRIFHMASDTEDDMKQWISAVEKASREHTAGTSRRGDDDDDSDDAKTEESGSRELSAEFVESVTQEAPTGQVTFVFTDVQSSTTLWEKVPDAMNLSLEQHDRILRELLKRFRGYEVKTEGDAFMVTFFCVEDAILWCLAVQEALFAAVWSDEFLSMPAAAVERAVDPATGEKTLRVFNGIRIRMGIHTGEPNCRRNPVTGRMDYFGPVVNRSARVSDTAHGGQVVCTQEVFDVLMADKVKPEPERKFDLTNFPVVKGQGAHNLKGIPDQVPIYELLPRSLMQRFFPPLRTINNEKKEKEERKAKKEAQKEEKKQRNGATGPDGELLSPTMGDRKGIKVVITKAAADSPSAPSTPRAQGVTTPTSATSSPSSSSSSVASSIGLPTASPRGSLNMGAGAALITTPRHARNSAVHTIAQSQVSGLLATTTNGSSGTSGGKQTPPASPAITPATPTLAVTAAPPAMTLSPLIVPALEPSTLPMPPLPPSAYVPDINDLPPVPEATESAAS